MDHSRAERLKGMPIRTPFGEADCEAELSVLGGTSSYKALYFDETPFNDAAISDQTYLIVGRRGTGKTALSQYFSFQEILRSPIYIDVDQPAVYEQVLSDIAATASEVREIAIPRIVRIWEYIIWRLILERVRAEARSGDKSTEPEVKGKGASERINWLFNYLFALLHESPDKRLDERIDRLLSHEEIATAKTEILKVAAKRPIIIALDTLEKYDISRQPLMNAMAALIQFAATFNLNYRDRGIHLKVFMSGEVFPYLKAEVIQNPLKSIKNPVYLFWRSKDLLRLIGWRFYQYLQARNQLRLESQKEIDWTKHRDVRAKMWDPYFGDQISNSRNKREDTLAYVLRHSQKRPRQVIVLCNSIADHAIRNRRFPIFAESDIRRGVRSAESELAIEIINSFSAFYPQVSEIVNGLMHMPMLFTGNELDKRAHETAAYWPTKTYAPAKFRELVAELGIVGRVCRKTESHIQAVFEYSLRDGLELTHRDECVIHPMFYSRLNIDLNSELVVLPIATDQEGRMDDDDDFL